MSIDRLRREIKKDIFVAKSESILNAVKQMDNQDVKLLIVLDEEKFYSMLSIGDIQRAILKKVDLNTPLDQILRKEVRVARVGDDFHKIRTEMLRYRTECMPVIDQNNDLLAIHFWEDLFEDDRQINREPLKCPVVIMAGGLGQRLRPITNIIPKPLVPLGSKSVMQVIIEGFNKYGISKFYATTNYKHEMIEAHFAGLKQSLYSLDLIREPKAMGTAGSLSLLKNKFDSTFVVTNCDIIVKQDFYDIYNYHKSSQNIVTLVGALHHVNIPYGTLETSEGGQLIGLREKPQLTFTINTGLYVLEPQALNYLNPDEAIDFTDLLHRIHADHKKTGVFPISSSAWMDIGQWKDYQSTLSHLASNPLLLKPDNHDK